MADALEEVVRHRPYFVADNTNAKRELTTYMRKRNGSHAVTPFRIYVNSCFDGRASIA